MKPKKWTPLSQEQREATIRHWETHPEPKVVNLWTLSEEQRAELEKRFAEMPQLMEGEVGFLSCSDLAEAIHASDAGVMVVGWPYFILALPGRDPEAQCAEIHRRGVTCEGGQKHVGHEFFEHEAVYYHQVIGPKRLKELEEIRRAESVKH